MLDICVSQSGDGDNVVGVSAGLVEDVASVLETGVGRQLEEEPSHLLECPNN